MPLLQLGLGRRGGESGAGAPAIVTDGLVAEWRFDDGSGQVLTDYGPNGYHGQLGSTTGADAADPAWTAEGLTFDGSSDFVALPAASMLQTLSAWTICCVFQLTTLTGGNHRIYTESSPANDTIILGFGYNGAAGALQVFIRTGTGSVAASRTSALLFPGGSYAFAALRRSGSNFKIYLNGSDDAFTGGADTPTEATVATIGAWRRSSNLEFINGKMALTTTHNRALSDAEVTQMRDYARSLTPSLP